MASLVGGAVSAAVAGAVCPQPVTVLHRGACWLAPKAPAWGLTMSCSISSVGGGPCRRLPAAASTPTSSGGTSGAPVTNSAAASATTTTAVTTMATSQYAGSATGGLPWKVQWQLQVSTSVAQQGAVINSSGADPLKPQAQQQPDFAWTPFDRAESVRHAAFEASGWDPELFNARLADLTAVLPDLPRALPSLSPTQLVAAMSDTHAMAAKVVLLKAAMPSTNVGMLLLLHPPFLDPACGPERLLAGVEHASRVLGGADVAEEVLQWYPPLLDPDMLDASVAQLRRLVPQLARSCLPSAQYGGASRGGQAAGAGGSGDARQLVHLLGIVMQREGSGLKAMDDGGGSLFWGCS